MKRIGFLLIAAMSAACNNQNNEHKENGANTTSGYTSGGDIYADIAGTYTDTLPCADCPGILTEVVLKPDTTFILRERYLNPDGRPAKANGMEGVYSFLEDNKKIKLTSTKDGGNPRIFEVQKDALLATNVAGASGTGDLTIDLKEKIISKVGPAYVSYRLAPFQNYPVQVFTHLTGGDIMINKPFLDIAKDNEKAIIAYYALKYGTGCEGTTCALNTAMNMDDAAMNSLVSKWIPTGKLPSQEEMTKSKSVYNLAMLLFIKNGNRLQANYNIMGADRAMSHAMDEFEISDTEVKLVKAGELIQQSKPQIRTNDQNSRPAAQPTRPVAERPKTAPKRN